MQNSSKGKGCWSELPPELLRSITQFLDDNTVDFRHFSEVCKNWRHSTAIKDLLPYKINDHGDKLFTTTVYLLRPIDDVSNSKIPWMVTAEESTKGNITVCHPFSQKRFLQVPKNPDLGQFQFSQLAVEYHLIGVNHNFYGNDPPFYNFDKVLFLPTSRCLQPLACCDLLELFEGGELRVCPEDDTEFRRVTLCPGSVTKFDDIVMYKGMICALDRQARLYAIDIKTFNVVETLIKTPICDSSYKGWRKRLVRSSLDGQLCLIVRNDVKVYRGKQPRLKVYMLQQLDQEGTSWVWGEVKDFGGQVLFVTRDYCFFVMAKEFPSCPELNNCIVFSKYGFPQYSMDVWELPDQEETLEDVMIFMVGRRFYGLQSISSFPNFPTTLWSQPSWAFKAPAPMPFSTPLQFQCPRETRDNEEMQLDSNSQDGSFHEVVSPPLCESVRQEQMNEIPSMNDREEETPREMRHCATRASLNEMSKNNTSMVRFEGFEIRSSLVATLQNIWSRHGNLVANSIIRNADLVAKALESLAKAVLILKGNSAESLDDDQVDYVSSTLADLQCMRFKVEWIAPSVEKALALVKSKPLVSKLEDLHRTKAKAEERRSKLVDELGKLDEEVKELEQGIAETSNMIPYSGKVDFAEPLGGELP